MSSSDSDTTSKSESESTQGPVLNGAKRNRNEIDFEQNEAEGGSSDSESDSDSDSNSTSEEEDAMRTGNKSEEDEAQVLSHAAKRKLKKKAQKAAEKTNENDEKEDANKHTETRIKRQNSVWVGNLAFKTTEQSLRDFFARHIPGCEITRVNLPGKSGADVKAGSGMRGQNKGFAYIDFSTEEAKTKAIEVSEQNLDGRRLLIKDGNDFAGRPGGPVMDSAKTKTAKKILATQKQPPAPTLFFGNLSFQVTELSLREMIERHRKPPKTEKDDNEENQKENSWIRKVRLGTFEDSGKCKGWAFIDFNRIEDATDVLINPKNHFLDGRKLVVEYASQEAVRRGGGKTQTHSHDKSSEKRPRENTKQKMLDDQSIEQTAETVEEPVPKRIKLGANTTERPGRPRRTKPGAALAMAKRETAAIVPSTGRKIVF